MEKQKNIPALRFPEYGEEWLQTKYGEVFSFRTTNSYSRENLNYDDGNVKNIHYGDIHTKFPTLFDITKELVPFINSEIELKRIAEDNYCKVGDLIIADASEDYGDVGKCIEIVNLNNEKVLAGLHTILARPDLQKMSVGFNGYLAKSEKVRLQIKILAQGSKVLSISAKRLAEIDLSFPTLPEQTKIANFLTAVDDRLQALKKKKTLLEQYKKGVMQKIFSQELRFKDENGNEFPDWEEKKLGDIANFRRGSFPQPYGLSKWYDDKNGMPFIQVYDVDDNMLLKPETKNKISELGAEQSVFVEKGTLIITIQGSIGRIAKTQYDAYVDRTLLIFQSYKATINVDYFKFVVFLLFEIEKTKAPGGIIKTITKEVLTDFTVPIPCVEEQTKIANFLSVIGDKITHCQTQIEKTEQYKKGLLQSMFC